MKTAVMVLGVLAGLAMPVAAIAQVAPASAPVADGMATVARTVDTCAGLMSQDIGARLAKIPDAPSALDSARVIPAGGTHGKADDDLPEICRVEGHITPTVGFLVRMPTKSWNGKFMMGGCGGPCGNYLEDRIDQALVRHYAVVTTDMGHKGTGWLFAYNNPQGQVDFAYRATHLTAVVAKEVVALFYGMRAVHNYFFGCSTGGRQAMIEAQRFPKDFEGIVAGAPVYDELGDAPFFLEWSTRVNTGPGGATILTVPKVALIHQAVLKQCDAKDGAKDGLVLAPLACNFDPRRLVCAGGGDRPDCLTAAQAEVAIKFHEGARTSTGKRLYWGMPWGSEGEWINYFGWVSPTGKQFTGSGYSITGYMGFTGSPAGPGYTYADFDYDRDPARLALAGSLFNPVNPDLSPFNAAGGKLILFHGYNDNNIPVEASIDYYTHALAANGGATATGKFFRFFALPGVQHCRGGEGGGEADWITALEQWVEHGRAPDHVIAYHLKDPYVTTLRTMEDYGAVYSKFGRHPLDPASYDRARPVYAWPGTVRYSGKGSTADPASWRAAPDG